MNEQFKEWAKDHAHELSIEYDGSALVRAKFESFAPLNEMIGKARVVAIGEPFHGGHEPLVMRNLLIQYLITELGFNAIALEAGVSPSKRLYDYVMMHSDQTDSYYPTELSNASASCPNPPLTSVANVFSCSLIASYII